MNIKATPVFQKNWNSTKKIVINRGGTRSSKTVSLLQLMLVWLMTGKIDDSGKIFDTGIVTVVRKEKTTLKATAIRDREEVIVNAGCEFLLNEQHRNMTDKIYKYKGRVVEFIGADDQQKLRGGKRDILYCNEANSLNYDQEFFQLFIRTTYKTFIDFNPDNEDVWINVELEQKRQYDEGDVEIIVSTYKDNPFLPEQQVKEIERLEKVNPHYWKIYGLGEYGKLEGVIFNNWSVCEDVPEHAQLMGYGMDFGYTNDPTTLIALYQGDNSIYIDEIIYETGLTNLDIDAMIVSLGLDKSDKFIADSAEPKSIEELYRRGINIHPCVKGKDSITYGIDLMKQFQFRITAQSTNTIREFKSYCWDQDKDGKRLNKPISGNDHSIDAIRYCVIDKFDTRIKKKERVAKDKRPVRNYITGELEYR